jgi:hypothetical protein
MRHSLYKYYSTQKWAEAFLDGEILFRSLSYFRDHEDKNVRGDQSEGTAVFRPASGLVGYNHTQGKPFFLPRYAFESTANQEEIFVFCVSTLLTDELRLRFGALVCVEITKIKTFCDRIRAALPDGVTFFGRRVEYYRETEGGSPRWALPDLIATSKLDSYAWQCEYRFVFACTDALGFEKVATRLAPESAAREPKPAEHHRYIVKTRSLRDILSTPRVLDLGPIRAAIRQNHLFLPR